MKNRDELFLDYKLQHELQYKLSREGFGVRMALKSLLHCKTTVVRGAAYSYVDVVRRKKGNVLKAHYANLYNCKSLWSCPTCAAYGLFKHRDKINALLAHYHSKGYYACMITFTVPHNNHESAETVLNRLKRTKTACRAHLYLPNSTGSITATEFTYNDVTGWHPHLHVLYFIPKCNWHLVTDSVEQIRRAWMRYLERQGYEPTDSMVTRSVHLSMTKRGAPRKITDGGYIAKEMAKLKTGKRPFKSRTPFQLLESDDPHDFQLFLEYAIATKGLSRVHYSKRLQKGVDFTQKKTDRASIVRVEDEILCSFTANDWNKICDDELAKNIRHRRRILIRAAATGVDGVLAYCAEHHLPKPYPPQRAFTNGGVFEFVKSA